MNQARNSFKVINIILFIAILSVVMTCYFQQKPREKALTTDQVAQLIQAGNVLRIEEFKDSLTVVMKDGSERFSHKESDSNLEEQLDELGVTAEQLQSENVTLVTHPHSILQEPTIALSYFLPFVILTGLFAFTIILVIVIRKSSKTR